jgi:dUTP pyrophosphatase
MIVNFKKLDQDAIKPERKTTGAVAFDLTIIRDQIIQPYHTELCSTGLAVELPYGTEMHIRARSSTFRNTNLLIDGTIDSDYRGEIKVMIRNVGNYPIEVKAGDRLAQGVISKVELVEFNEVEKLSDTDRGTGGFGSTGLNTELKTLIDEVVKNG